MKVGLYSITYLGLWYNGPGLTFEELVGRAKEYGYDGIEIDGKRPHGNPLDWPSPRCKEAWKMADDAGIEIYAVAANNDFSSPIPEHREAQLAYVRDLIRMTSDLGVGVLRVFAAWPGVTVTHRPHGGSYQVADDIWKYTHKFCSDGEAWLRIRECLAEAAGYAADYGVTLALQNHPPVTKGYKDTLRFVKEVNSPNLKICLDAPLMANFEKFDEEQMRKAALEVGELQVLSHFGGEYLEEDADGRVKGPEYYVTFAKVMNEIGYEGYIGYELCHPLPIENGETVGIEYADRAAKLAAKFMRQVMADAAPGLDQELD